MELSDPDKRAEAEATFEPREKRKSNEISQNILAFACYKEFQISHRGFSQTVAQSCP